MKQLVVISGKGGTGKSSIVAAFAALAQPIVTADCDVDAADLHLIFRPEPLRSSGFEGGLVARIDPTLCIACGICQPLCRFDAIAPGPTGPSIDPTACEGCGVCVDNCPHGAIEESRVEAGQCFASTSRFGPLAHARLNVAAETSGRLVTRVREEASALAEDFGLSTILIDGSPGIGCPVIASITGVDLALIVTEPTVAGEHDMARVLDLCAHFRVPTLVCVNKADINETARKRILDYALSRGARWVGDVPYDPAVTKAMVQSKAIPEAGASEARDAIIELWTQVSKHLEAPDAIAPPRRSGPPLPTTTRPGEKTTPLMTSLPRASIPEGDKT
jgi:MinD superfamily P-loop ATPase